LFLNLWHAREEAYTNPGSGLEKELTARGLHPVNRNDELIFLHCTVINELYSTYEWFVESALTFWLFRIPQYFKFSELEIKVHNAYRNGMARVIRDIEKRRYKHLNIEKVLEKYLACLQNGAQWEFVHEALTSHDTNLRRNEIEQLFVSVGLANIWALLEKNPLLSDYVSDADSKTLEQWLLDLVTYRNDATHGRPDEILGMDSLREWVGFVTSFCGALADIITHRVVQCEINSNPQMVIGIVTERFRNNVVVATCNSGRLHVGQQLYFFKTDSCIKATIESLHVQNLGIPEIIINEEVEVGIKTSCQVSKNSRIIFIKDV
jgi:hypothetical protein